MEKTVMKVLIFYAIIVFMFLGCQTSSYLEETVSQTDVYKFGTKEFNPQCQTAFYDFEARYYYPAQAALSMPDPQAEKYPSISPYSYTVKNPICIDLKGDSLAKVLLISKDSLIRKSAKNAAEQRRN